MPTIQRLFSASCPTAIALAVIGVVIFPLNGFAIWNLPHVQKELFKFPPFVANGNTSSAIMVEILIPRVKTPLDHVRPTPVCSCAYSKEGLTMCLFCRSDQLRHFTAAGFCVSRQQGPTINDRRLSTATNTEVPSDDSAPRGSMAGRFRNDLQASKYPTNKRCSDRHSIASFNVVFSGERSASTVARCDNVKKPDQINGN